VRSITHLSGNGCGRSGTGGGLSPGQEEILALTEREIDMYERYSSSYGSVMYVMQKTGSSPQ
jgi:hypothetical protein